MTQDTRPSRKRFAGRRRRLTLLLLMACAPLAGCTSPAQWVANGFKVGPNYCTPAAAVGEDWIDADDKRVLDDWQDNAAWWARFNDPLLNELVAEAYRQNLTLREAGARVLEARQIRAIAIGQVLPQQQSLSGSYSYNKRTGTGPDRHFSVWNDSFSYAWELDFWGRYRRAVTAADADLDASIYDYGDVVVTLVADVAATYVDIRTLQVRLKLVQDNVENQRKTYNITVELFNAGAVGEIDVQQTKSSLAQTEAIVPQLQLSIRQAQNALCVLLGVPPVDIQERLGEGTIPDVAPEIAVGIPAQSLLRRPDVRRAERRLAAQSELIGIAESDLYPHITMSGNAGVTANSLDDLFRESSSFASFGPSFRWDVLNYGRIVGNVGLQDARFQQLLQNYRQTVLVANLEAENAITRFLKAQTRLGLQTEAAEAAGKTNDLVNELVQEGEADFNRVFNVQNFKRQQEESAAIVKGEVAQSLISIYLALGGGWPSPYLGEAVIELPPVAPPAAGEGEDVEQGELLPPPLPMPPDEAPLDFPEALAPLREVGPAA